MAINSDIVVSFLFGLISAGITATVIYSNTIGKLSVLVKELKKELDEMAIKLGNYQLTLVKYKAEMDKLRHIINKFEKHFDNE